MKRREFIKTSLTTVAAAAIAQSGVGRAMAASKLKVGVMIPLSGPAALFGPSSKNVSQMAAEKINAGGGILGRKIEILFGDAGLPPAEAAQTALRMWRRDGCEAFVGMHNSAVRGAYNNVFKGQVPYVYCPNYEGGECANGVYYVGETPAQSVVPTMKWLAGERKLKKFYLIGNDYNWPRDTNVIAKKTIAELGGQVVGEEYMPFTVDNFDSSLAKIKKTGADMVFITLVGGASVTFNRAFASFGLSDKVTRLGTLIDENTLLGIGAENSKNIYSAASYFANIQTKAAKAFAQNYATKFGSKAPVLNALSGSMYDGLIALDTIAERAGSLSTKKMDAVAEGAGWDSPRGRAKMANRHLTLDIYLAEAKGTNFEIVKTFPRQNPGNFCKA
jgi:ABC-type branched-subunit amino acid transport system substrate-binding protein